MSDLIQSQIYKSVDSDDEMKTKRKPKIPGLPNKIVIIKNSEKDEGNWMETKFKWKQHMDQDSRMAAFDKVDVDEIDGDGRRMDDYVVLDEKRSIIGVVRIMITRSIEATEIMVATRDITNPDDM